MTNKLNAISPIDGRYSNKTKGLSEFFSEKATMKYRLMVEVKYLKKLGEEGIIRGWSDEHSMWVDSLWMEFSDSNANYISDIEARTKHDVKAIEYFLKEEMKVTGMGEFIEAVHLGLTSQDICSIATSVSIKDAWLNVMSTHLQGVMDALSSMKYQYHDVVMLARTHGQPASPTTLGKELAVFSDRLHWQMQSFHNIELFAKFGGATGGLNAHMIAYPNEDWVTFMHEFVESFGLQRTNITTQVDHNDSLAEYFHSIMRMNTILIDLCRDMWQYISMDYMSLAVQKGEIGSSTMPHKVNPIDFENAEGNLGVANALLSHFSEKLPISRLQRDLSDSTVMRNIGVAFSHTLIAYMSIEKGMSKLSPNIDAINLDLNNNWAVVTEGIQTVLRTNGYEKPYEDLKALSAKHSGRLTKEIISEFIDGLDITEASRETLRNITPFTYTGNSSDQTLY